MKKLLSLLLSLAIAVTAVSALAVSASAIDLFPDAVSVKSGKEKEFDIGAKATKDFKFEVTKKGTLELELVHTCGYAVEVHLMDKDGGEIKSSSSEIKSGSFYTSSLRAYSSQGIFSGTIKYNLKKGTYYLRLKDLTDGGEVSFTATYPSKSESSVDHLSLTLKKGDTIQLGAVLSDGKDGTADWSSSKSSVASVSSKGKVTAKAKGTAVITAKVGDSSVKITIKVTA